MATVRIVGIDPGFDRLGVAIIEKEEQKETLIFSTCIQTSKKDAFEKRLFDGATALEKIIENYSPHELAIETLFFTKNQKTVITVAEMRGICIFLGYKYGLQVFEYSPPQIKSAIAGYGGATKEDIKIMVERILKQPLLLKSKDDEVDAIAIALTHSANRNSKLISKAFL
jgi:crossover junction endodeoxyribonuclease RuvC